MSFFKILVIGEVATGKSSLVSRIVQNTFQENYKATIGCEFGFKAIEVNGVVARVQLWDLAGQDRLGGISRLYCRDSDGALVVADSTRPATIEQAAEWREQVNENVRLPNGQPIPFVLCVNKSDLVSPTEKHHSEMTRKAQASGFEKSWMTSAKTGDNVNEALAELIAEILRNGQSGKHSNGTKLAPSKQADTGCRC